MWREHPGTGVGAGALEVAYPPYQSWWTSDLIVDHAHNDYIELLAETGVTGAVLLAFGLYLFARGGFFGFQERLRNPGGWMKTGAIIACCGIFVHSFTDFNLHIPANAAWFSFCAALSGTPLSVNSSQDTTC